MYSAGTMIVRCRDFNSNMWMIENFYAGGRETDDPSDRLILLTIPLQTRPTASEHEFQSQLDQPRVVDRIIHDSKGSRLKEGLWRTKLRMVEEVEELSPEL
jgi:hypothetical protein